MTPPPPPPPAPAADPPLRRIGTVVALVAAAAQVLSAFHRWDDAGRVGADVALVGEGRSLLNVGTSLLVLAALPALTALVTGRGWPRLVSAVGTAALVLAWVALGPVGPVTAGVWLAAGAVCGHLVAAALARP